MFIGNICKKVNYINDLYQSSRGNSKYIQKIVSDSREN